MFSIHSKAMDYKRQRDAKKRDATQNAYSASPTRISQSPSRTWPFLLLAIAPVLVTAIALILSLLCVYAGHTQTFLQDYAVLTLNTSRIGENMVHKLDDKIRSFQLDDIGLRKRGDVLVLPATPTVVPTTLITMAPVVQRNIFSNLGSIATEATGQIGSDASSLKSKGKGEISEGTAYLHSKANSIESAVASEATSIVTKIEDEIIKLINDAYTGLIEDIHFKDFYNVHVMTSCTGTYSFQNGTNITVGESGPPSKSGPNSVHDHIDSCEQHSAVDPMSLIKVVYWLGIIHIGLALLLGTVVIFKPKRWLVFANGVLTLFAFIAMALASAVAQGLATAATKVINFLGDDLGIAAYLGHKFIALTWTATALLALDLTLIVAVYISDKRRRQDTCTSCANLKPTKARGRTHDLPLGQMPQYQGRQP